MGRALSLCFYFGGTTTLHMKCPLVIANVSDGILTPMILVSHFSLAVCRVQTLKLSRYWCDSRKWSTQGEDIFHDHFFLSEKIWKPHPQPFIDEWRMICTKNVRIYHFWEPIPLFFHSSSPLEVHRRSLCINYWHYFQLVWYRAAHFVMSRVAIKMKHNFFSKASYTSGDGVLLSRMDK